MKKLKRIFLFLIFSIFTLSFSNTKINVNAEIDYSLDGGLYEIDFNETSDLNNFSIFSEHDQLPYISEGTLYFRNTCEQKVIFKKFNKVIKLEENRDSYQKKELLHFFDILEGRCLNDNTIQQACQILKITRGII